MIDRINRLNEIKLLFVSDQLKEYLIDYFQLEDSINFVFNHQEVDFNHARHLLLQLAKYDPDIKSVIKGALLKVEKLSEKISKTALSPNRRITITGLILAYLTLNKTLNYTLPPLEVYLLKKAPEDKNFASIIEAVLAKIDKLHNYNTRVVILTPIKEEFQAVFRQMKKQSPLKEHEMDDGTIYLSSKFRGKHQNYDIFLRRTESGLQSTATFANQAITDLEPAIILLVGNAGAIKSKLKIGDIVVGTTAYEYQSGSDENGKKYSRPKETRQYSERWIERAKVMVNNNEWKKRIDYGSDQFLAFSIHNIEVDVAPIISGDRTIKDKESDLMDYIHEHFGDAYALEKEATGVLNATRRSPLIDVANIRSISDLLNDKEKTDELGYKILAASHSSAFAFEMLNQIKKKNLISTRFASFQARKKASLKIISSNKNTRTPKESYKWFVPPLPPNYSYQFGFTAQLLDALKSHTKIDIYSPNKLNKTLFLHAFLHHYHHLYRHIIYCSSSQSHSLLHTILSDISFLKYLSRIKVSVSNSFQERQIIRLKSLKGPNLLLIDNLSNPSSFFDFSIVEKLGNHWTIIILTDRHNKLPFFHTLFFPNLSNQL